MKKILVLFLVLFISASSIPSVFAQTKLKGGSKSSAAAAPLAARFGNIEGITAAQMRNYLEFIASDELEGRDTPSRGLDIAAMYIADHLRQWGVKPAGENGTYFQRLPLRRHKIDSANTKLEINGQTFNYGEDFLASGTAGSVSGELVFVGSGWFIKSNNPNPYQGLDVRDKIVVNTNVFPAGASLVGTQGVDWDIPADYARKNGAKAIITIGGFNTVVNWNNTRRTQTETGSLYRDYKQTTSIPSITASPRLVAALFQGEKANGASLFARTVAVQPTEGFALNSNKKISLNVVVKIEKIAAKNVVGVLEGSDPVLKNEYVAVGAHYDHDGISTPVNGDAIYNGADDDGSGTVAVMAIAEALAKGSQRPKRSMLFVWHAGEEKGLWGSEYFADNPTVPITSIVTQLNIDMIGRAQKPGDENHPINKDLAKPNEVFVVGSKMMSSELGELSETVNNSYLKLSYNYKFDDPNDPERIFYRSDHYNYARRGVPIIFYTDGTHEDYHKPSDTIDKINFDYMERITRTIFATGWELANRPTRPKVDKPLSIQ